MTAAFARALASQLPATTRVDPMTRGAYAGDASLYRAVPAAVLFPRDVEDVVRAVRLAREHGVPVTSRGGGTSIAGNSLGPGLLVDFSRYMNRVREVDPEAATVVAQPGAICDDLTAAGAPYGLAFPPDPSTHARCTIGGMVGNNSCGAHSAAWGTTADHVRELEVLLADGRIVRLRPGGSGDATLDDRLTAIRDRHLELLRTELGRFRRQVSGYGLHRLLPEHGFDTARAFVGSEGTCGIVLSATVGLVPTPAAKALLVLGFPDVIAAAEAAPALPALGALTAEGLDGELVDAVRRRPGRGHVGDELPPGRGWLMCEVGGATPEEALDVANRIIAAVPHATHRVTDDPVTTRSLWRVREDGSGIATRAADGTEAWAGWEDAAVPPENFAAYLGDFRTLLAKHGRSGILYGHFGEGCAHVRIDWPLHEPGGIAGYRSFVEDAADLVAAHGGTVSGEHGDGRARSELLPRMYSAEAMAAFGAFKHAFDPDGVLNPGVIVDPAPLDAEMRFGPPKRPHAFVSVQALHADGGSFSNAVRRCVGVGKCRVPHGTAMCPSYQATRDEVHSTRGRARLLAEMLEGDVVTDGWRSTEVRDALDLCLSCKACKSDCPVDVDMATYKAEFLHHHYEGRLRPRTHYSLGWLPLWLRLAQLAPALAGPVGRTPSLAKLAKTAAGVDQHRDLPPLPGTTLQRAFRRRGSRGSGSAGTVVLWPDSFTNLLEPRIGTAAVEVLEALGYRVVMPKSPVCCGLTWYSTGQLGVARRVVGNSVKAIAPYLAAGYPVLGLEPSCASALRDEARELLPDDPLVARLSRQLTTLPELLAPHESNWPFGSLDIDAVVQVHCHQTSTKGAAGDLDLLRRIGVRPDQAGPGCCGLAGDFGFAAGHYEVSQACAEQSLYPKVRGADTGTVVVADGLSCRTQVTQGTGRTAVHTAELLRRALR
ncbi:MAG: FAD-binding protein [Streptosporangiales bacterium]|nr:FAD-binding protein [Streptosporangiales bacterium]